MVRKTFLDVKIYLLFFILFFLFIISFYPLAKLLDAQSANSFLFVNVFFLINFYIYTFKISKTKRKLTWANPLFANQSIFKNFLSVILIFMINVFLLFIFLIFDWGLFQTNYFNLSISSTFSHKVWGLNFSIILYSLLLILLFTYSFLSFVNWIAKRGLKKFFYITFIFYIFLLSLLFISIIVYGDFFFQSIKVFQYNITHHYDYQYLDVENNILYYSISFPQNKKEAYSFAEKFIVLANPLNWLYLISQNSFFTLQLNDDLTFSYMNQTLDRVPQAKLQLFSIFHIEFGYWAYNSWILMMWLPWILSLLFLSKNFFEKSF